MLIRPKQMLSLSEVNELTELAQLFHSSEGETLDAGAPFEFSHSTKRGRDLLYRTHSACLPFLGTYLHGMQIISATEAALEDDQEQALIRAKNMLSLQKMERLSLVLPLNDPMKSDGVCARTNDTTGFAGR
jgi:hypothetical protein